MSCWDEYLVLGKGLAAQPFEGAERSALSRAYYGAFNISRRWLESNVTPIDNHRAHEQVWPGLEDLAPRAVVMAERIVQLLRELDVAD